MKKFWFIILSVILGLFTACSDDASSSKNTCTPECKAYESCNENAECELKTGMCKDDNDCSDDKPICDANECVAKDLTCNPSCDDSYQICSSGVCETKTGMCATSNDCSGEKPVCSSVHQCVADNNNQTVTIRQIKDMGIEGNTYTTHGIVTAIDDDGFFMQDESDRGIYVYQNLGNDSFTAQKVGDKVTVIGVYKIYYGLNELTYFVDEENPDNTVNLDITTDSSNNDLPEFKVIGSGVKTLENFESMLIKLDNPDFVVVKAPPVNDVTNHNYTIEDKSGTPFFLFDSIYNLDLVKDDILTNVQGVLTFNHDKFKLIPREAGDISLKELICDPVCEDFQECRMLEGNPSCKLKEGMCETEADCISTQTCEDHLCVNHEGTNLVPNGDLEDWLSGTEANGWIFEYNNEAGTTSNKESSTVFEGSFSAKVKKVDSSVNTSGKKNEFLSPAFTIDNTKQYNISMKLYDNDVNVKARIYFKFYDETGHSNGMTGMTNGYTTNTNEWKEYTYPDSWDIYSKVPDEQIDTIKTMRVGIRLSDDEGAGDGYIYIDDVKVTEKILNK